MATWSGVVQVLLYFPSPGATDWPMGIALPHHQNDRLAKCILMPAGRNTKLRLAIREDKPSKPFSHMISGVGIKFIEELHVHRKPTYVFAWNRIVERDMAELIPVADPDRSRPLGYPPPSSLM
ncbi:hypothetical protein J3A83DRAFT_4185925 [Scleroderma citrinum]